MSEHRSETEKDIIDALQEPEKKKQHRHIGVDFDETLAHYSGTWTNGSLGEPIPEMIERVKRALARGWRVTVFTARVERMFTQPEGHPERMDALKQRDLIEEWTEKHIGRRLSVTAVKLRSFSEFWDDKAVRVQKNLGVVMDPGPCWMELDE